MNNNDPGKKAYEENRKMHPAYRDDRTRPSWENQSEIVKTSWNKIFGQSPMAKNN